MIWRPEPDNFSVHEKHEKQINCGLKRENAFAIKLAKRKALLVRDIAQLKVLKSTLSRARPWFRLLLGITALVFLLKIVL